MDADILIVGAGCAGLSLAVHLLEAGASDLQILLVDRREVDTVASDILHV